MKLDKIVVASGNEGKIAEIKAIFKDAEIVSMGELGFTDEIEETGSTFKENAYIKAAVIARALLLKRMEHITDRRAHFESAVCLCTPDGKTYFGEGKTFGKILQEEIGTNGFGYDCLFFSDDLKKSFGIAEDDEKNAVSHRFRALQDLKSKLK